MSTTRYLALAAGLAAALLAGTSPAAADLRPVVRVVKKSVVAIGTYEATRRPPAAVMGTGFVVSDGLTVITNAHVLPAELDDKRRERLAVFVGTGTNVSMRETRVRCRDDRHDLAVLAIEGAPLPPLRLAAALGAEDGLEVAFTGYPIGAQLGLYPATHRGIISALTPVAIPLPQSRQLTPEAIARVRDNFTVYQLDAVAYPGNSGSPLYDVTNGTVIGIVNSTFVKASKEAAISDPSGISYAIPVRHIHELLAGPCSDKTRDTRGK